MGNFLVATAVFSMAKAMERFIKQFEGVSEAVRARMEHGESLSNREINEFTAANTKMTFEKAPILSQAGALPGNVQPPMDLTTALNLTLQKAAAKVGFGELERIVSRKGQSFVTCHNGLDKGVKFTVTTDRENPTLAINLVGFEGKACHKVTEELKEALHEEGLTIERVLMSIDHGDPRGVTREQVKAAREKQKNEGTAKQAGQEKSKTLQQKIYQRQAAARKVVRRGR
jgi:hypothetical protein